MRVQIFFQKRYLVALLAFIGYVNMCCLSASMSMAIVEMTSIKTSSSQNGTQFESVEFEWDFHKKGLALSIFSYGYLFIVFGGIAATRFGGATTFGVGIAGEAFISFFIPFLVRSNFALFLAGRVLQGVFEAFSFSSAAELWSKWSSPNERSRLISTSFTGLYVGIAVCFPISGAVAKVWGWPAIFYVTGTSGIIWSVVWFTIVKNDPAQDKHLSQAERELLTNQIKSNTSNKKTYPWKAIIISVPVWTLSVVGFVFCIGYTFSTLYLPLYIKDINNIDIKTIGILAGIPHLFSIISHPLAGYISDVLRSKNIFTATQMHKVCACIGFFIAAALLYGITFCPNFHGIIFILGLYRASTSFIEVTFHVNVIDLSINYASLLLGITTTFFVISSIITPNFIEFMVRTHSQSEWNLCFTALGVLNILAGILYICFSSGERQPWDILPDEQEQKKSANDENIKEIA